MVTSPTNTNDVLMSNSDGDENLKKACTVDGTNMHKKPSQDAGMDSGLARSNDSDGAEAASAPSPVATKATEAKEATVKRRRVSFHTDCTTKIFEIPLLAEYDDEDSNGGGSIRNVLFYSQSDYDRFKASEQRRNEKMIAKKLQKLVQEQMQPRINEAVANGATLEDIEAMMPKTHEEMVAMLGYNPSVARCGPHNPENHTAGSSRCPNAV